MPTITLRGNPYPKQIEFFKLRNKFIAYGGARGGGKSWAARRKALMLALNHDYRGIQILLLRRRYSDVYENHVYPLLGEIGAVVKYNDKTKSFDFPWGSRIIFGYCDNERDIMQYQGKAFDVIFVEEATQFTEFMLTVLTESLRPAGFMFNYAGFTPRMYFTCNPGGAGHAYIKRLFIDKEFRGKEKASNYAFVPSTVFENDFIMQNDPTYVEILENLPEQRKKAMLYGDWNVFEGQFFTEFRDVKTHYFDRLETHVIGAFPVPEDWVRYRVMDWGYSKPFSIGWYAVDTNGIAYRYREWYGCTGEPDVGLRMTPEEVATHIREVEKELEPEGVHIRGIADPAVFSSDTGKSIAETFSGKGVYFDRADNSRLSGWQQMRERLKFDKDGAPKLYFFHNNKHAIRTLPKLMHDTHKVEDLDTTQEDHIADEIRYFCMSRPIKTSISIIRDLPECSPLETYKKPQTYGLGIYKNL